MTNTTSTKNAITFTNFGNFVKSYDKATVSISKSAFEKAGISNYTNLNNLAKRIYISVSHMMELREANAEKTIEAMKAEAIDISVLISMINNSHATDAEKLEMTKFITGKSSEIAKTEIEIEIA